MVPLAKILLPVDFSERSIGAIHCVQRLAQRFSPEIILLHVLAPMQYRLSDTEMGGVMLGDLYRAQIESLTLELEQFQQAELAGCNVRRLVLDGDPASRIVEFAHDRKRGPDRDAHPRLRAVPPVHSRLQHRQGAA